MRAEISTIRIDAMAHKMPFRYRSHEVSRLEAFSDVIFGFALSLIVVSLEVPKTYGELMETVRGVRREEAAALLRAYRDAGGIVYNPGASSSAIQL